MKYIRILATYLLRVILRLLFLFPIKINRIVFSSMFWRQYSCNPKYVSEYLMDHYGDQLDIIWAFTDPENFSFLKEQGVQVCKARSLRHYYLCMTSAIMITNTTFGAEIPHRRGQYRINTWHGGGGGYKKIDYNNAHKYRARLECRETDLFCASSETSLRNTVRIAFQHNGDVFCGTPRNDMLINNDRSDIRQKVEISLGVGHGERVLLYAPTYREGNDERHYDSRRYDYGLDYLRVKRAFEKRFGGTWVVAVRFHPRVSSYRLPDVPGIIDATKYPDMQELLASVDAMITDYSSSLWDFSFTAKPCLLFCEDLEEYVSKRGFNKPIEEWGFCIAKTNGELEDLILNWSDERHKTSMETLHRENGSFEDGHATERLCALIMQKLAG